MILRDSSASDLELEIRKIYTRNPRKKMVFKKRPSLFTTKAEEVIDDPSVEIVVEALGFQSAAQLPQFRDYFLRAFATGNPSSRRTRPYWRSFGKEIWAAAKSTASNCASKPASAAVSR